ncbi:unnamed protein product [Vitrella brassicaformis CCMP3155]|uniref:UBA domain-containing protein n=1 Tax=Vitrella brassicaformis (strain CCMP3155) TaxID=1169540 RepID=A0A0G4EJS6_VITBC|nr:unnamed protein product [Vitrella brassicaformis CCMP3155]|eukprot:CEL96765.1 unnamed protein product [Vitrella brassicaformis CCMP3155]
MSMQLTFINQVTGQTGALELPDDMAVSALPTLLEDQLAIPAAQQAFVHNGKPLVPTQTLKEAGLSNGELVMVVDRRMLMAQRPANPPMARAGAPAAAGGGAGASSSASSGSAGANPLAAFDFSRINVNRQQQQQRQQQPQAPQELPPEHWEQLAQRFIQANHPRNDPHAYGTLVSMHPPLADAVKRDDLKEVSRFMRENAERHFKAEEERLRQMRLAAEDPFNLELQHRVEQEILEKRVDEQYEMAQEHMPEAFGQVFMLYIDCEINDIPLKAFVDSGAQSTIMSVKCMERCHLGKNLDKRFAGIAKGVGTSKIVGRIHIVKMKLGNGYFPCSITVLEDDKVDFLFGLDMLRRHQAIIDLKANVLRVGDETVPFLSEAEVGGTAFGGWDSPTQRKSEGGGQPSGAANTTGGAAGGPSTSSTTSASAGAAPPAAAAAAAGAAGAAGAQGGSAVEQLVGLGFSRQDAENALRSAGGSVELAAALLFEQLQASTMR